MADIIGIFSTGNFFPFSLVWANLNQLLCCVMPMGTGRGRLSTDIISRKRHTFSAKKWLKMLGMSCTRVTFQWKAMKFCTPSSSWKRGWILHPKLKKGVCLVCGYFQCLSDIQAPNDAMWTLRHCLFSVYTGGLWDLGMSSNVRKSHGWKDSDKRKFEKVPISPGFWGNLQKPRVPKSLATWGLEWFLWFDKAQHFGGQHNSSIQHYSLCFCLQVPSFKF